MSCTSKMDAGCVIYNMQNPGGDSGLHNLNLGNGVSLKQIVERIDQMLALAGNSVQDESFQVAIAALGLKDINSTTDLLAAISLAITETNQQIQNITQTVTDVTEGVNKTINGLKQPAVSAGPVTVHHDVKQAIQALAEAVSVLQGNYIGVSPAVGNQIQNIEGLYVSQAPISQKAGNGLVWTDDGLYATSNQGGLSDELTFEKMVNVGLNAEEGSSLDIKFKQLFKKYTT